MATVLEPLTNRPLTERPAWKNLEAHCQNTRALHLRDLFADDQERGRRLQDHAETAKPTGARVISSCVAGPECQPEDDGTADQPRRDPDSKPQSKRHRPSSRPS